MITDEQAFRESVLEGDTVREIEARYDVPRATVHRAIQRGSRKFIEKLHLDLIASHANGELPAFLLPDVPGPTMDRALDLMRFVTRELSERGMEVRVHYRTAHNGLVICFEDRNPPTGTRVRHDRLETTSQEDH